MGENPAVARAEAAAKEEPHPRRTKAILKRESWACACAVPAGGPAARGPARFCACLSIAGCSCNLMYSLNSTSRHGAKCCLKLFMQILGFCFVFHLILVLEQCLNLDSLA